MMVTDLFWPLMWASSGWGDQEYGYNHNVSVSLHSLKIIIFS